MLKGKIKRKKEKEALKGGNSSRGGGGDSHLTILKAISRQENLPGTGTQLLTKFDKKTVTKKGRDKQ